MRVLRRLTVAEVDTVVVEGSRRTEVLVAGSLDSGCGSLVLGSKTSQSVTRSLCKGGVVV